MTRIATSGIAFRRLRFSNSLALLPLHPDPQRSSSATRPQPQSHGGVKSDVQSTEPACLIELCIPVTNRQTALSEVERLSARLTEKFGGVTTFLRSPAEGQWMDADQGVVRDTIIVIEVMAETLDRAWWSGVRKELEEKLQQDEIVIRARAIEQL